MAWPSSNSMPTVSKKPVVTGFTSMMGPVSAMRPLSSTTIVVRMIDRAPGGTVGNPPAGDGVFDEVDGALFGEFLGEGFVGSKDVIFYGSRAAKGTGTGIVRE